MFIPERVYYESGAAQHPRGRRTLARLREVGVTDMREVPSHNRVTGIPGRTPQEAYRCGKRTLVVGLRKSLDFQTCRPSAHYQLPLVTGCPGMCQYCYLATRFGKKPYVRVYVNTDEILQRAMKYAGERAPVETSFEGSAVSDPIPTEQYTGALSETVRFVQAHPHMRFRFVTKYTEVGFLRDLDHGGRTHVRFSVNTDDAIGRFEHLTPSLEERLAAASEVRGAGYPTGILIAPVFVENGWKEKYGELLRRVSAALDTRGFTVEIITHRYTTAARTRIQEVFTNTSLDMDDEGRRYRRGQFGYGKYVYPDEVMKEVKNWFAKRVPEDMPGAEVEYVV